MSSGLAGILEVSIPSMICRLRLFLPWRFLRSFSLLTVGISVGVSVVTDSHLEIDLLTRIHNEVRVV
jgi:hypothetical protein